MKRIPNLDTLRFIAASLVIIHHIELYKNSFSVKNYFHIPFFASIGKLGVVLFFVLSGFLITTLLLQEKEKNGTISFKKFYLRRVLRIWPVYYLVIILGFFVYPNIEYLQSNTPIEGLEHMSINLILYATIFANVAWAIFGNIPFTTQTWSLATEEQFYLIWPAIINKFKKHLLFVMVLVVLCYNVFLYLFWTEYVNIIPYHKYISRFLYAFNINCMAIGGIFAVLIFRKSYLLDIMLNKVFFYCITILTIILLLVGKKFSHFHYDIYSVLFAIIISNLGFNEKVKTVFENRITNYLGTISYGLYMYHSVLIVISIKLALYFDSMWLIYPLTFGMAIFVSHISFKYFESYFLKFKLKYSS